MLKEPDQTELDGMTDSKCLSICCRLLVAGDVFAIPVAGLNTLTGRTHFTKTLFSASGATQEPELRFCKVVELQPEWPTAMVVDPLLTAVTLEVQPLSAAVYTSCGQ